jgi:hypothetical protein
MGRRPANPIRRPPPSSPTLPRAGEGPLSSASRPFLGPILKVKRVEVTHSTGLGGTSAVCAFLPTGFCELLRRGEISGLPRLFAVQPENCAPLHATFLTGGDELVIGEAKRTNISEENAERGGFV